jgi:hypothetical protein
MLEHWLHESVLGGVGFHDGEIVDVGWMSFRVSVDAHGVRVAAPQVGSSPMAFVEDCSTALNLIAAQQYLLDSFGAEACACSCRQTALVVNDLFECETWYIDRLDAGAHGESGWFFGAHESRLDPTDSRNLGVVSLWDLFSHRPYVGPFLQLPPGWQVSFEERPIVHYQHEPVAPYPRSFYTRQYGLG